MEGSPLQLVSLVYTQIHVQPTAHAPASSEFDSLSLNCNVGFGELPDQGDDPRDYTVEVRLWVSDEQVREHRFPYHLDMGARGHFRIAPGLDASRRKTIVEINGASLLVGAIRDMVTTLTARSVHGPVTLPTLRFIPESEE
ncbi:hypothetical protein KBTX_01956 [wastewater metagenome]|uniref:Uncharacterized protein n=2 Tax=unclassified sequences TaxID=12908 RepID=A0A5B8RC25_9ZZZZ|nr:hypothetical protein [Arhodomonas sp. KWT]QEA05633.1 hypothetical protein KBTEX_01956 [uncultured organism]